MVIGIVIPHEIRVAFFAHQFGALEDYQAAVGGYVEPVYLADARLTIYVNEEGKVRQLPVSVNVRAVRLAKAKSQQKR